MWIRLYTEFSWIRDCKGMFSCLIPRSHGELNPNTWFLRGMDDWSTASPAPRREWCSGQIIPGLWVRVGHCDPAHGGAPGQPESLPGWGPQASPEPPSVSRFRSPLPLPLYPLSQGLLPGSGGWPAAAAGQGRQAAAAQIEQVKNFSPKLALKNSGRCSTMRGRCLISQALASASRNRLSAPLWP